MAKTILLGVPMPRLSDFQLGLLSDMAAGKQPIALLPSWAPGDTGLKCKLLADHLADVRKLQRYGLIDDLYSEFREFIETQYKKSGRRYHVFGLTAVALKMFHPNETTPYIH